MTISDDSRTYECPNCLNRIRKVAPLLNGEKARRIDCEDKECKKLGYSMMWV